MSGGQCFGLLPCVCLFDCGISMGLIIRRTTTLLPLSHIYNLPGWGPEQLEHIAAQTARAVGTHCSCQPPRRPEQLEHIAAVTVIETLMRQNKFKTKPLMFTFIQWGSPNYVKMASVTCRLPKGCRRYHVVLIDCTVVPCGNEEEWRRKHTRPFPDG